MEKKQVNSNDILLGKVSFNQRKSYPKEMKSICGYSNWDPHTVFGGSVNGVQPL